MNNEETIFDLRNRRWQALCEKYEKRGAINTEDCSFAKVNYKLFARPNLRKSRRKKKQKHAAIETNENSIINDNNKITNKIDLDVDISDIIDDDIYEILPEQSNEPGININQAVTNSILSETNKIIHKRNKGSSTKNCNSPTAMGKVTNCISSDKENCFIGTPNSLIHFVEVDLNSNLKAMLIYRSECKILEIDDYNYWHNCTKTEMKRLRKYITKEELKEYMRYCNKKDIHISYLHDRISGNKKNSLRDLLLKREFARNDKDKYLKYCNKIYIEWQILINDIPVEHLILYASYIIRSIKERRYSLSIGDQAHNSCTLELQKESIDSGFFTTD